MNSAALKKVPLVGTPEKDLEQELSTAILAYPQLIVNGLDHLKALHEGSHPAGFAHLEVVAQDGKRDFKQKRVEKLDSWRQVDSLNGLEDVFVAINPLYMPAGRARRTNDNVSQVNWLWVDIDCASGAPDWAYAMTLKLETRVIGKLLPDPTMIVSSGRGLWLFWGISPISAKYIDGMAIWRQLMNQFGEVLRPYGADRGSTDPARLMRLAGSVNSKSGQKVSIQRRGFEPYDIKELAERYLPAVKRPEKGKRTGKATKSKKATGKKPKRLFTMHSQNYSRFHDIERLIAIREGEMTGRRNVTLFLYSLYSMYYYGDVREVSQKAVEVNELFSDPLSAAEVTTILKSAQGAYSNDGNHKWTDKTSTIIRKLAITADEQKEMETLIGAAEKRRRNTINKREKRGSLSKEERAALDAKEKQEKIENLRTAIAENPSATNSQLAGILGVSLATVKRWKKAL